MKQLLFILCLGCLIEAKAQTIDCPTEIKGAISGTEINALFDPATLTEDTWADPMLMQDRRIFFVHGLGGQGDDAGTPAISWFQASLWSEQEYMINSARPDYNNISLEAAAVELKGDFETFIDADDHAIVIAHSQGGIVSRRVDKMYTLDEYGFEPRTFGGLVTFGTPHQGAMIINNIDDLQAWIGTACVELSIGPVTEFVEDNFFLDLFLSPDDYEGFTENFCGTFENEVLPVIMDDYMAGTTSAYAVGADYLETLNAFVPEIPYVCFYGNETDPVLWNAITHLFPGREPNNAVTYGEEPFGATNDMSGVNFANAMIEKYAGKYDTYSDLYEYYNDLLTGFDMETIGCYLSPLCIIEATIARTESQLIRDSYERGWTWMTDANLVWEQIIGARVLEFGGLYCHCYAWTETGSMVYSTYPVEHEGFCTTDDPYTTCYIIPAFNWIVKENDGIVLKESASECLGQVNRNLAHKGMYASNHFSMRNDLNTQLKLAQLYSGTHGLYFRTSTR